jgi:hypothetical protein
VLLGDAVLPSSLPEDGAASLGTWPGHIVIDDLRTRLNEHFQRRSTWHPKLEGWGQEEGDRIDIWREGSGVAELIIRIDVRQVSRIFLKEIVQVARDFRLVVLTDDNRIREPTMEQLRLDILRSDASAFVADPDGFLEGLRDQDD